MEDSFILSYDTTPPLDVRHSDGGRLRITAEEITLGVSAKLIAEADEERSDIIEISKSIVDSSGYRHSFSTTISAYELWDAVSTSESSYLESAYIRSWQCPKGCEQVSVVSGLNISADMPCDMIIFRSAP